MLRRAMPGWILPLLIAFSAVACRAPSGPLRVGEAAPALAQPNLDGRMVRLRDYRDRVVVVDFWATWCGPCHIQAEILKPLYESYRAAGVEFFAISLGEDVETVRSFLARRPLPYPVLTDAEDRLSARHELFSLPSLMIVDRRGVIAYFQAGLADGDELRRVIDGALATSRIAG